LPVGGGLLYVEPVYIRGTGNNAYPQLTKVLVSFGDQVGYADTLPQALDVLFGTGTTTPTTPTTPTKPGATPPPTTGSRPPAQDTSVAAAVAAIQKALEALKTAQQKGDFAGIGQAQSDLDKAVKQFEAAQKNAKPAPTASPSPAGGQSSPTPSPSG
jgi:uncharacterized membrane protein (UPF0182 family)